MRRGALALLLCAGCALPVVSAGNFLPAGDLVRGQYQASISMEAGRVLAGPGDINDKTVAPETAKWEVLTWFASDATFRWQALDKLTLEAQLKFTNPVDPFVPEVVGGSVGGRVRLTERKNGEGLAVELGGRFVGVAVEEDLTRSQDGRTQTDRWYYRALGFEMPLIVTYRVAPELALTASPFLRAYYIRAWHEVIAPDLSQTLTRLDWTPVLSAGLGVSVAMQLGWLELAPGCALELATRPGPSAPTKLLVEPGLSIGVRF
jgi:hypothetical protein